jgi:hypothetical protein
MVHFLKLLAHTLFPCKLLNYSCAVPRIAYLPVHLWFMLMTSLILNSLVLWCAAHGSVAGWGTILQAGSSPVRVPDEVDFFNLPNPSSRTMALGSTQPPTEISIRNFPGGKKRPGRRADNLAAICEPNAWKCGSLNLSQPYGPACTRKTLPYYDVAFSQTK